MELYPHQKQLLDTLLARESANGVRNGDSFIQSTAIILNGKRGSGKMAVIIALIAANEIPDPAPINVSKNYTRNNFVRRMPHNLLRQNVVIIGDTVLEKWTSGFAKFAPHLRVLVVTDSMTAKQLTDEVVAHHDVILLRETDYTSTKVKMNTINSLVKFAAGRIFSRVIFVNIPLKPLPVPMSLRTIFIGLRQLIRQSVTTYSDSVVDAVTRDTFIYEAATDFTLWKYFQVIMPAAQNVPGLRCFRRNFGGNLDKIESIIKVLDEKYVLRADDEPVKVMLRLRNKTTSRTNFEWATVAGKYMVEAHVNCSECRNYMSDNVMLCCGSFICWRCAKLQKTYCIRCKSAITPEYVRTVNNDLCDFPPDSRCIIPNIYLAVNMVAAGSDIGAYEYKIKLDDILSGNYVPRPAATTRKVVVFAPRSPGVVEKIASGAKILRGGGAERDRLICDLREKGGILVITCDKNFSGLDMSFVTDLVMIGDVDRDTVVQILGSIQRIDRTFSANVWHFLTKNSN